MTNCNGFAALFALNHEFVIGLIGNCCRCHVKKTTQQHTTTARGKKAKTKRMERLDPWNVEPSAVELYSHSKRLLIFTHLNSLILAARTACVDCNYHIRLTRALSPAGMHVDDENLNSLSQLHLSKMIGIIDKRLIACTLANSSRGKARMCEIKRSRT